MKNNPKLHSAASASAIVILFLIVVSSTASAASSIITETQITKNPSNSENPAIYGDNIVWQDDLNGNWDIYIQDLSTKKQIHTTDKSNQINPDIYGKKVVWEDERNGGHDIYLQDLSTKVQTRITKSGKAINPAIYDNKIVWQDKRNGTDDIYMYDISTKKETQITTSGSAYNPKINGNRIVWEDNRNGNNFDIGVYDLLTHKETLFDTYYTRDPVIYGNRVVWVTDADNILIYDFSTSSYDHTLSYDISIFPAINGDRVVYDFIPDRANVTYDIWMYDLSTKKNTQITTSGEAQYPAIYGDRIVWQDYRNGNWDIYMGTLISSNLPVASFSASPTSGKAPLKVQFTDKSTGSPTSWKWSFGDGSALVYGKNPTYTYKKPGVYTVKETVSNSLGKDTEIKTKYVKVIAPVKPVASFSVSLTSGKAPLKVQFTDKSTGSPTSWKWSFGDGTYSTAKSPAHTYSKAGKYTVSLTVKNAKGSNTKTMSGYITVSKK